jgi:metal-responsive CopG/Arc/MetJ family transcriptional regulator
MKEKISVTVDRPLVQFLDSLAGRSRSEKIERVLRSFKAVQDEVTLRRALAGWREADAERSEREAWERTMESDQWNESAAGTSGRLNSLPTRNRGRRSSSASAR